MNDDKHKIVQELLLEIFNNINSWLTHAEAKNAAIIAFNVACLAFIWDMMYNRKNILLVCIVCVGMLLSTIMALISFFPQVGKETNNIGGRSDSDEDNLLFYMDIAKYCKEEYIKAVFKQYAQLDIQDTEIQKIERDFSEEITYNAFVVMRKYRWFNYAVRTEMVMLVLLMVVVISA